MYFSNNVKNKSKIINTMLHVTVTGHRLIPVMMMILGMSCLIGNALCGVLSSYSGSLYYSSSV